MIKDEEAELMKEFEEKFGFKTYESLKSIMTRMYIKIKELEESRNNWRSKFTELQRRKNLI